jgi:hypothetical protein
VIAANPVKVRNGELSFYGRSQIQLENYVILLITTGNFFILYQKVGGQMPLRAPGRKSGGGARPLL